MSGFFECWLWLKKVVDKVLMVEIIDVESLFENLMFDSDFGVFMC